MRKFSVVMILVLAFAFLLGGCGQKATLKVGTEATFAPFEFTNDKNEIIGFDIDLAKEIAKKLNRDLEIVNMDFDGLIPALQANQIDLAVAGMTVNPERRKTVNFSTPYYDASQVIVVQKNNTSVTSRQDLEGKVIAVQLGTTGGDAAAEVANAKIKRFGKVNEAFLELDNGRADAVIIDAPVAKNYMQRFTNLKISSEPFTEEQYAIAIKKENTELLEKVNQAISEIVDSGKYDEIYKQWFPEEN